MAYEDELEELMAREPKVVQNGQGKRYSVFFYNVLQIVENKMNGHM